MSNQEAVDAVKNIKDALSAAKRLTEEALNRKSSDDISCVVVKFQWPHPGFLLLLMFDKKLSEVCNTVISPGTLITIMYVFCYISSWLSCSVASRMK